MHHRHLVLAKQLHRLLRQAVERPHVAPQCDQVLGQGAEAVGFDAKRRQAPAHGGQRKTVAAAVKRQHLALPARVPQHGDRLRGRAELLAVIHQPHLGVGEGHGIDLAPPANARDGVQLAKPEQLPGGVADVAQRQRCELVVQDQPRDFCGVGGHQVNPGPLGALHLGAQDIVRRHGGDLDLDPMALLEHRHKVRIGIARPGQHPHHRLGPCSPRQ